MDQPAPAAQHYDLFTSDGHMQWRLQDRGLELRPDCLALMRAGRWTEVPFGDVVQVKLAIAFLARSRPIGQCTLVLANGGKVVVMNANASGLSDGERDTIFRQFVKDVHRALVQSGAASAITFHAGFSERRMNGLRIALVVATLFFVALPVVLLLATRDPQMLWILLAGVVLVLPAYRAMRTNQPATYNPGAPPDLLP